jgi:hypothetical protein
MKDQTNTPCHVTFSCFLEKQQHLTELTKEESIESRTNSGRGIEQVNETSDLCMVVLSWLFSALQK